MPHLLKYINSSYNYSFGGEVNEYWLLAATVVWLIDSQTLGVIPKNPRILGVFLWLLFND